MDTGPSCSVCLELFVEPRVLSCGHSFCTRCIQNCSQYNQRVSFKCPVCKREFNIRDASDISRLPRNFDLEKSVEAYKRRSADVAQPTQSQRGVESTSTHNTSLTGSLSERSGHGGGEHADDGQLLEEEEEELRLALQMSLAESTSHTQMPQQQQEDDEDLMLARAISLSESEANTKKQSLPVVSVSAGGIHDQFLQNVNLKVKNLDESIDDEDIDSEFSRFGTITSSKVIRDHFGRSRGYAFVCFCCPGSASRAIEEMHGRVLGSKQIRVGYAQTQPNQGGPV